MNDPGRLTPPPHSLEAEMVVLGCALLAEDAADLLLYRAVETDFYSPAHRAIFRSMLSLNQQYRRIDTLTLKEELTLRNDFAKIGGAEYLEQLIAAVESPENVGYYIDIIIDRSILRGLQSAAFSMLRSVHDSEGTVQDKIIQAERLVYDVTRRRVGSEFVRLANLTHEFYDSIEHKHQTGEVDRPVQTGLNYLDQRIHGFYPGNLIILAARPAVGKTSLALLFALAASKTQKPVAIFSLEMSSIEIVRRVITMEARVNAQVLRREGKLSDKEFADLTDACNRLYERPLFVDDSADISPFEMLGKCRRLAAEHGDLALVVVDYLQLMRAPTRTENRVQQVAEIARGLKNMAKELGVPVVALSQLSRQVVHREKQIPQLSDLRESGSIEADADVVLMLYELPRDADDVVGHEEDAAGGRTEVRHMAILVRKNRNGPVGAVPTAFKPSFTLFEDPWHDLADEIMAAVRQA